MIHLFCTVQGEEIKMKGINDKNTTQIFFIILTEKKVQREFECDPSVLAIIMIIYKEILCG